MSERARLRKANCISWVFSTTKAAACGSQAPREELLHHPAILPQAAAVFRVPPGQLRVDPALPYLAVRAPSRTPDPRTTWPADAAPCRLSSGRALSTRGSGSLDLRRVRRSRIRGQGDAVAVHQNVLLERRAAAIRGVFPLPSTPPKRGRSCRPRRHATSRSCRHRRAVGARPGRVGTRRRPVARRQPAPASHAAATAHFDGEVLPGNAGLQHKEDAGQAWRSPTVGGLVAEARGLGVAAGVAGPP